MGQERRKFERIKKELLVSYTRAEGIPVGGICKSIDVSLGGIGLLMPCSVELGEAYNLVIKFPGLPKKFYITARVINTVRLPKGEQDKQFVCRVGLVFINFNDEQRQMIKDAMAILNADAKPKENT